MNRRAAIAAIAGFLMLGSSPAWAEATGIGSLQGVVTSESHGLALHRVSVTLRSEGRAVHEVRATDRDGLFRFDDLPPGLYSLEAARIGFQDKVLAPILVLPGRELTEQIVLPVAPPPPQPAPKPRTS